jgi:hypothetical protein
MALTPYITSRDKLKEYILEELGQGVVRIEVTAKQLENQINKSLEEFIEVAEGGVQLRFATLDTITGQSDYTVNYDVQAIVKVIDESSNGWISVFPDKAVADLYGSKIPPSGDLISVEFTRHYLDTLEHLFKTDPRFDFNPVTKVLHLFQEPSGDALAYVYYQKMDHSSIDNIYDNLWIKDFSVALSMRQWGVNLMKFGGTTLPGGLQHNFQDILSEAKENIERLRLDLLEKYSQPAMFLVG